MANACLYVEFVTTLPTYSNLRGWSRIASSDNLNNRGTEYRERVVVIATMRETNRTLNWDVYLRGSAVVLAAFVVTGLIFVAFQRVLNTAQQRIGGTFARANETDMRPVTSAPRPASPGYSPGSPFSGSMPARAGAASRPPSQPLIPASTIAPPQLPPGANSMFPIPEDRRAAQIAVQPLRQTLNTVKEFDTKSLWADIPDARSLGTGSMSGITSAAQSVNDSPSSRTSRLGGNGGSRTDQAVARQQAMQKICNQADALAAEVALVAHPSRYPEKLRDIVGEATREARQYLSTVQYAAIHPEERSQLRPLAQKHLNRSEELLRGIENVTGSSSFGTTTGAAAGY
jgi:hypothetical protein